MIKKRNKISSADFIRHMILSWLTSVLIEYLLIPLHSRNLARLSGLADMSMLRIIILTSFVTVILTIISAYFNIRLFERWCIAAVFSFIALFTLISSFSLPYLIICIIITVVLILYSIYGWDNSNEKSALIYDKLTDKKIYIWITAGFSFIFFLFISMWTVCRVYSFSTPSYDFGIFAQMFYNMKNSGIPLTTIERDGMLSHFNVHMSPIYYIMLPFYFVFPFPASLQVMQAAVITSAVIPLWKIGKNHGFKDWQRMLLCLLMFILPAFSGGTSYDIHENCFLSPLILWLFYGIEKRNTALISIAAVLTLMVKEDAAVYVAVIALWLIVQSTVRSDSHKIRNIVTGVCLFLFSIGWFLTVTAYLQNIGDGVMTYRYRNFMYDGSSSLFTVIKSVIICPMKALYECVDPEKLHFIAVTMLPLALLPIITRKYERFILLIPYVLVNLMSDYPYQHDIFYQYSFGSSAFLIYLTIINLADIKIDLCRKAAFTASLTISALCFMAIIFPKAVSYPVKCFNSFEYYQNIRDTLSQIPENASVTATTFYTTYLSQREILYDIQYCSYSHLMESDYIILNGKDDTDIYLKNSTYKKYRLEEFLISKGYSIYKQIPDVLTVYMKNS